MMGQLTFKGKILNVHTSRSRGYISVMWTTPPPVNQFAKVISDNHEETNI